MEKKCKLLFSASTCSNYRMFLLRSLLPKKIPYSKVTVLLYVGRIPSALLPGECQKLLSK